MSSKHFWNADWNKIQHNIMQYVIKPFCQQIICVGDMH